MTKAKYEVWRGTRVVSVYVTEKHNAEYMLQKIRGIHEKLSPEGKPYHYKVVQVINGESKVIYTPKSRKFWGESLEV